MGEQIHNLADTIADNPTASHAAEALAAALEVAHESAVADVENRLLLSIPRLLDFSDMLRLTTHCPLKLWLCRRAAFCSAHTGMDHY